MNAKETVKSYMDGIVAALFAAEQAYALLKANRSERQRD